jgi:hypothetical protein
MIHQKFWSHLFLGFPSWVLESVVLPAQTNLLLLWLDLVGQPTGGHTHAAQALLSQEVDPVDQGHRLRCFERCRLFAPSSLEPGESAYEGGGLGSWLS